MQTCGTRKAHQQKYDMKSRKKEERKDKKEYFKKYCSKTSKI